MLVWRGFLRTSTAFAHGQLRREFCGNTGRFWGNTFVVDSATFLYLLGEACKVDNSSVVVRVNVKQLYARTKMVHELA